MWIRGILPDFTTGNAAFHHSQYFLVVLCTPRSLFVPKMIICFFGDELGGFRLFRFPGLAWVGDGYIREGGRFGGLVD